MSNEQSTKTAPDDDLKTDEGVADREGRWGWWRELPRRTRLAAIGLVLVLLAAAVGAYVVKQGSGDLPEGAVLRFDEHIVTEQELDDRLAILEALYGVQQPEGAELGAFRRDAAKSVAVSLILDRAAQDEDVSVPEKQATDALASIIDEQLPEGRTGFARFLESTRLTEADVLAEVRLQLVTSELFEAITDEVDPVTPAEVAAAYADRREELATPQRRRLSNVVVATVAQARRALARVATGESFASVARSVSLDASSRDKGGDLGLVSAAELVPAYSKEAFSTKVGSTYGPVKTQYGWNVGLVRQLVPGRTLTFEEVSDRLAAQLLDERRYAMWRSWLAEEIKDADVEYADDYRPADPDAPPADGTVPTE